MKKRLIGLILVCAMLLCAATAVSAKRAINESNLPQKCPILLYHHLVEGIPRDYENVTSAKKFESDIARILKAGYHPISLEELYDYLLHAMPIPPKSVVITFDDGYESNYSIAFPILKKYGVKADIFLNNNLVGSTSEYALPHFSWDQAREMEASGLVKIYSHGYIHHDFTSIPPEQLGEEYTASREEIDRELGTRKYHMVAYVGGDFNSRTFEVLDEAGADVQLLVAYQKDYTSIWGYSFFSRMTVYYTTDVLELLDEYQKQEGIE